MLLLAFASVARAGDGGFVVPAWPYPGDPVSPGATVPPPDATTPLRLPGSDQSFTLAQVRDLFATPDWYPSHHPPMPGIVARGRKPGVHACGYCHLPDGQGRPENAALAGLSAAYMEAQVADFRSGARRSAWHGAHLPTDLMRASAEKATRAEVVIESGWVHVTAGGDDTETLGQRIIEVAIDYERHELRDSASGYRAYVPQGSVTRGQAIAQSGQGGPAHACVACHGEDLRGVGLIPPLAGRSPTYIVRQLLAFRTGSRSAAAGAPMMPVVALMSVDDMMAAAAYAASLEP